MINLSNHVFKNNKIKLKTAGDSMLPLLQSNDIVFFKKISFVSLKVNDIVIVGRKNVLFAHRIVYKINKRLITKGDNNLRSDGKIFPRQIIGKVDLIKRSRQVFDPENLYLIQSTQYFQEIVRIKSVFDKNNIDYVFLKGLPLHLYYEKTHPRRFYADCDVLIDKKDFLKAESVLVKFGYKKAKTELSQTHKELKEKEIENAYVKIINPSTSETSDVPSLRTGGFPVVFDLHLEAVFMMTQLGKLNALYPQKLIDQLTDEFLKTKRKVKINNESFLILNTYYLILYLALHLFHHNFRGAFRYDFLDLVIRKSLRKKWEVGNGKLDKEVRGGKENHTSHFNHPTSHLSLLTSLITKYRLQNFVYPVFVLLKKHYQTPIPNSFIKGINPLSKKWEVGNEKLDNEVGSGKEYRTSHLKNPASHIPLLTSILKTPIFDDEPRVRAGINRFKNLFWLSPYPIWKKIWVFFNPQVVYSVFWVVFKKFIKKK